MVALYTAIGVLVFVIIALIFVICELQAKNGDLLDRLMARDFITYRAGRGIATPASEKAPAPAGNDEAAFVHSVLGEEC